MFGDDIFDLKPFDQHNRDKKHSMAAIEPAAGTNNYFIYKLCQNEFTLAKGVDLKNTTSTQEWGGSADTVISSCKNKGNGYITNHDGTKLNCVQSFKDSLMSLTTLKNGTITGWNMDWESQELCSDD